jgi:hypothetical protein
MIIKFAKPADTELAGRLAGIEQIKDAVARGHIADFGRRRPTLSAGYTSVCVCRSY